MINKQSPPLIERAAAGIATHPRFVLLVVLVLALVAGWGTSTIRIYTARNALFPKHVDVYRRLESFLQKFGAVSELVVVVESAPQDDLRAFATELAARLRRTPEVKTAMERFDPQFVLRHAYLLLPPELLSQFASSLNDLTALLADAGVRGWDGFLDDALRRLEHQPANAGTGDLQAAEQRLALTLFFVQQWQRFLTAPDEPGSIPWQECITSGVAQRLMGEGGYFTSRDGKTLFLFVRSASASEEYDVIAPFIAAVRETAEELRDEYRRATSPSSSLRRASWSCC